MNANSTTSPQPATKPRAWQYGKYLSHTNQTEVIPFCHSFDLSQNEKDAELLNAIACCCVDETNLLTNTLSAVASFCTLCKEKECVGRVFLDLSDILADDTSLQIALFARLRMLVRNTNVVAFTILHPDINGETLFRYGDCVIALQPWQGITPPDEFSDTAGLLRVIHLPAHLSLYTPKKSIFIYGVKRSMHSLHLSELRIPPMGCKEYSGCDDLF